MRRRLMASVLVGVLLMTGLVFGVDPSDPTDPIGTEDAGAANAVPPVPLDLNSLEEEPIYNWGVVGVGNTVLVPKPEVWAFEEIGDYLYVGGTFTGVQEDGFDPSSQVFDQSYLAAFHVDSGEWISTFTPTFDRAVYDLEVSPDGNLIVGGEFTTVNGQSRAALVTLDPLTGATVGTFEAELDARDETPTPAYVHHVEVVGDDLYVGGLFNYVVVGPDDFRVWSSTRLDATTGAIDATWVPRLGGSGVWDIEIDEARNRVYMVGTFTDLNGASGTALMGAVSLTDGSTVPGLTEFEPNRESQTTTTGVELGDGLVFVAAAEHITHVLDADTLTRVGYNTTGVGCEAFDPNDCNPRYVAGGDIQVAERFGDWVIVGCHCFEYRPGREEFEDILHYSSITDQRTAHRYAIAYEADTGAPSALEFVPGFQGRVFGTWAIHLDRNGCLLLGGDYTRTRGGYWLGGFGRMCSPLEAPASLDGTTSTGRVALSWPEATGPLPIERYRVTRDGVSIGDATGTSFTDVNAPEATEVTYAVEAIDVAGRNSATVSLTITVAGADQGPPTEVTNLAATTDATSVTLSWDAATDDIGVVDYMVHRDYQFVTAVPGDTTGFVDEGRTQGDSHLYQVRARDAAGNISAPVPVNVTVGGEDIEAPAGVTDLAATTDLTSVTLTWTAAVDNVGVDEYLIHRDYQFVTVLPGDATGFGDLGRTAGDSHLYQVRARDAAGNLSVPVPISVIVGGVDNEAPAGVTDLVATSDATSVTLSWSPAVDNFGVDSYLIHRDFQYVTFLPGDATGFVDLGRTQGDSHLYQVRARDAAGNISAPVPLSVTVGGVDNEAPAGVTDLVATSDATSVTLSWTPAVDNFGVDSYLIHRDYQYVTFLPGDATGYIDLGRTQGDAHLYQVRARDAAGNVSAPIPVSVTVGGEDTEVPTGVTDLAATTDLTSVTLSWTPATDNFGVDSYLIHRDFQYVTFLPGDATGFVDLGRSAGDEHFYQVRARDAAGNVSVPVPISVTVGGVDDEAPTGVTDLAATSDATSVTLSWTPATDNFGVDSYLIHRDFQYVTFLPGDATGWTDLGRVAGDEHLYQVRARDAAGNLSAPVPVTVTVDGG